jgi:hypothetical protein
MVHQKCVLILSQIRQLSGVGGSVGIELCRSLRANMELYVDRLHWTPPLILLACAEHQSPEHGTSIHGDWRRLALAGCPLYVWARRPTVPSSLHASAGFNALPAHRFDFVRDYHFQIIFMWFLSQLKTLPMWYKMLNYLQHCQLHSYIYWYGSLITSAPG